MPRLTLVSHHLCPYVQRAAIALAEKEVPFERLDVDLADRPAWFTDLSPLGKVPLLKVEEDNSSTVIFESAVILEFLEDTLAPALHPADPLERARHRSWIEFGSAILDRIAAFYNAPDETALDAAALRLADMFARVEDELDESPWFGGDRFSLVDAVYGPVFRYFDTFDRLGEFGILSNRPRLAAWRQRLAKRPSVRRAAGHDYAVRLHAFIARRNSSLAERARRAALVASP